MSRVVLYFRTFGYTACPKGNNRTEKKNGENKQRHTMASVLVAFRTFSMAFRTFSMYHLFHTQRKTGGGKRERKRRKHCACIYIYIPLYKHIYIHLHTSVQTYRYTPDDIHTHICTKQTEEESTMSTVLAAFRTFSMYRFSRPLISEGAVEDMIILSAHFGMPPILFVSLQKKRIKK